MRIIAGKYKKANLFSIPGNSIRPTADFTKEVIFSIIQEIDQKQVLDLFTGCGSLGLEALSRGAKYVTFVDFSEKSIKILIKNFERLHCGEKCRIYRKKVFAFLKKSENQFDLIFMDPPYNKNLINSTVKLILENELLNSNGKIIIEHSPFEKPDEQENYSLDLRKISKNTHLTILSQICQHSQESRNLDL